MDKGARKFIQEENEKLAGLFSTSLTEMKKNIKNDIDELEKRMDEKFERMDDRFDTLEIAIGKRLQENNELRDRVRVLENRASPR